jgi:hypothetical protein
MAESANDGFYVGYLPRAPKRIAAHVRTAVAAVFMIASLVALVLVNGQQRFPSSVFEFGVEREFSGLVRERPYPLLLVPRPGRTADHPAYSSFLLTVFGKLGAERMIEGLNDRSVRLRGSLIHFDGATMVQIAPGSVEALGRPPSTPPAPVDLGEQTLVGEIIDSKCFLGVMKPGNLKPHRSCAVRWISGGVPPMLLVRDEEGRATYFLLVSPGGDAVNRQVLSLVAEPVEITGRVVRHGDLLILESDPRTYRRL